MLNNLKELWDSIIFAIKKHKVFFFVFICCLLITLIIALITSINYFNYLTIQNLTDKLLVDYLNKKIGILGFFFKRFFQYIILFLLIYLFSCNKYTCFINIILCCYITFNIFYNIITLFALFSLFGLLHGLLICLICGLSCVLIMFFLIIFLYDFSGNCSKTSNYFTQFNSVSGFILIILILIFIISLYEILLIPFSTSTFVVVF